MLKQSPERSNHLARTAILQSKAVKIFNYEDALKVPGYLELQC